MELDGDEDLFLSLHFLWRSRRLCFALLQVAQLLAHGERTKQASPSPPADRGEGPPKGEEEGKEDGALLARTGHVTASVLLALSKKREEGGDGKTSGGVAEEKQRLQSGKNESRVLKDGDTRFASPREAVEVEPQAGSVVHAKQGHLGAAQEKTSLEAVTEERDRLKEEAQRAREDQRKLEQELQGTRQELASTQRQLAEATEAEATRSRRLEQELEEEKRKREKEVEEERRRREEEVEEERRRREKEVEEERRRGEKEEEEKRRTLELEVERGRLELAEVRKACEARIRDLVGEREQAVRETEKQFEKKQEELRERLEVLQKEKEGSEKALQESKTSLQGVRRRLAEKESELESTRIQLQNALREREKLEQETVELANALHGKIDQLEREKEESERSLMLLQEKSSLEKKEAEMRLTDAEKHKKEIEKRLKKDVTNSQRKLENHLKSSQEEMARLEREKKALEEQHASERTALQSALEKAKTSYEAQLQGQKEASDALAVRHVTECDDYRKQIREAEAKLSDARLQLRERDGKLQTAEENLAKTKEAFQKSEEDLARVTKDLRDREQDLIRAKEARSREEKEMKHEIDQLTAALKKKDEEMARRARSEEAKERAAETKEVKELRQRVEETERQRAVVEQNLQKALEEAERKQKDMEKKWIDEVNKNEKELILIRENSGKKEKELEKKWKEELEKKEKALLGQIDSARKKAEHREKELLSELERLRKEAEEKQNEIEKRVTEEHAKTVRQLEEKLEQAKLHEANREKKFQADLKKLKEDLGKREEEEESRHKKDLQEREEVFNKTVAQMKQSFSQKESDLQKELKTLRDVTNRRVGELEAAGKKLAEELHATKLALEASQTDNAEKQKELQQKERELKKSAREVKKSETAVAAAKEDLARGLASARAEADLRLKSMEQQLAEMQTRHEEQLAQLNQTRDAQLRQMELEHQEGTSQLRTKIHEIETQLQEERSAHGALQETYAREQRLLVDFQLKVNVMSEEVVALQKKLEEETRTRQELTNACNLRLAEGHNRSVELETQLADAKKEVEKQALLNRALQLKASMLQERVERLKSVVSKLRKSGSQTMKDQVLDLGADEGEGFADAQEDVPLQAEVEAEKTGGSGSRKRSDQEVGRSNDTGIAVVLPKGCEKKEIRKQPQEEEQHNLFDSRQKREGTEGEEDENGQEKELEERQEKRLSSTCKGREEKRKTSPKEDATGLHGEEQTAATSSAAVLNEGSLKQSEVGSGAGPVSEGTRLRGRPNPSVCTAERPAKRVKDSPCPAGQQQQQQPQKQSSQQHEEGLCTKARAGTPSPSTPSMSKERRLCPESATTAQVVVEVEDDTGSLMVVKRRERERDEKLKERSQGEEARNTSGRKPHQGEREKPLQENPGGICRRQRQKCHTVDAGHASLLGTVQTLVLQASCLSSAVVGCRHVLCWRESSGGGAEV